MLDAVTLSTLLKQGFSPAKQLKEALTWVFVLNLLQVEPITAALREPPVPPLLVAGKDGEQCPSHVCWLEVLVGSLEHRIWALHNFWTQILGTYGDLMLHLHRPGLSLLHGLLPFLTVSPDSCCSPLWWCWHKFINELRNSLVLCTLTCSQPGPCCTLPHMGIVPGEIFPCSELCSGKSSVYMRGEALGFSRWDLGMFPPPCSS